MKQNLYINRDFSRNDMELLLETLRRICNTYGYVTVGDLYCLRGHRNIDPRMNCIGWKSLLDARVTWTLRGMAIKFPPLRVLAK